MYSPGGVSQIESKRCWTEVTVFATPVYFELVSAALNALGANGVVILGSDPREADGEWAAPPAETETGVRAFFPADDLLGEKLSLLRSRLSEASVELSAPAFPIQLRQVAEADWAEAWKSYYHPLLVEKVAIVPRWEDYTPAPGILVVRLDPGLAFGAGTHPTTQQALRLLQKHLAPGDRVLDVGTGSGILALAAALLGAGHVRARDVDPMAVAVATENVEVNGLSALVTVEKGDLLNDLEARFDLILANLVAPLLLELLPSLGQRMAPGAKAMLGGIIRGRADEIKAAIAATGLTIVDACNEGEWVALVVRNRGGRLA